MQKRIVLYKLFVYVDRKSRMTPTATPCERRMLMWASNFPSYIHLYFLGILPRKIENSRKHGSCNEAERIPIIIWKIQTLDKDLHMLVTFSTFFYRSDKTFLSQRKFMELIWRSSEMCGTNIRNVIYHQ